MATTKVVQFPIPQQVPAIPQEITQAQLRYIVDLRQQIDELKARLGEAEERVQGLLEQDVQVQPGLLRAFLKKVERRTVAWKEVVVRKLGASYAKRVLASTKPTEYTRLVVTT